MQFFKNEMNEPNTSLMIYHMLCIPVLNNKTTRHPYKIRTSEYHGNKNFHYVYCSDRFDNKVSDMAFSSGPIACGSQLSNTSSVRDFVCGVSLFSHFKSESGLIGD